MDERRIENALAELNPPEQPRDFFERLAHRVAHEYGAGLRRRRIRTFALNGTSVAATAAACLLLVFGSPLVGKAAGSGQLSLAALTIVDKNLLCHTPPTAPMQVYFGNYIDRTSEGTVQYTSYPATAGVSSARGFSSLAAVQAGPGAKVAKVLYVNKAACVLTKRTIALNHTGLSGPPVRFGKGYNCPLITRALVHLRAVNEGQNVVAGFLAVRKENGGPIAFASIDSKGQGGVYVSSDCS